MTPRREAYPGGVKLIRTELGGVAVLWGGRLIGWMHASLGDKWNAYVPGREAGDGGRLLGRFTEEEAVRQIALEAGWREAR
jgi:hypothetical protein